ncbi:MAG: betaine-aldehyde dehydrogenase [Gaiellales bacterium]|nr:betaine-aldehyde dehydrogenase [Gaiellales bacterium]
MNKVETRGTLIGGRRMQAADGSTLDAVDPSTGEVVARIPRCGPWDVDAAVSAARSAFPEWSRLHPAERASALTRLADAVERRGDELARLDSIDNGSPLHEMRRDIGNAPSHLRYFAGLALQLRGQTIPVGEGRLDYTLRQPFGVVARIVPFNHPLMFAATKIAAPLIAGNTVVLKPSEHTSLSTLALADDLAEIFPPGVVNVVTGLGSEAGDALVAHRDVRRIAFIGSVATGLAIQRRAAETTVKTVTLELGGKNPIVIFPEADVEQAIDGALRGMAFTWQGQSCGSTSRLLVHRDVYADVVDALAERIGRMQPGPPLSPDSDTGAIVNEAQLAKVLEYVELGVSEGARLAQEEIFGPVLAAMPFDDYEQALEIANGVSYGLTASIFTRDLRTAHAFARDVEAGFVWVNDSSRHFTGVPFGGVKDSGVGREEDLGEVESYTELKNVHVRYG